MDQVFQYLGYAIYFVIFLIALWGAFCVVMVWSRVRQKQFANEVATIGISPGVRGPVITG